MVRSLLLYMGILLMILVSCQKETSFEVGKPARGSLQSSAGDCLPKVVHGTYKASQVLVDSNYIDVTLDIAQTGTYTVFTDTVNGYSFKATGNASATGPLTVRLKGSGTPLNAELNNFAVYFDTTTCFVPITVLTGSSSGGTSVFTLTGAPNACTSATPSGTYMQNVALTATNKVQLQVNVTTIGTWTLSTSTVTGFSFAGSGTFSATGPQTIELIGTGTPTTVGSQTFTVTVGSASCTFPVTVTANTAPPAAFSLQGAPGVCMNATPSGTFTQGTALTSANKVVIQVNVTTPGQWTVSTNTVAGMTFSGTGTFAAAGAQTITLNGTGTPGASGSQTFTVTAGTSTCTFSITVGGTTPSGDHFILTANSWWSYDDGFTPGDTLKRTNIGAVTGNGNTYREFEETDDAGQPVISYYFRKDAATNFYYEYAPVDDYSVMTFDQQIDGDILFLKENLTTGTTWTSTEWSGTDSTGPRKLRYAFTCTDANATVTVNGKSYSNVYKVTMKSQTTSGTSTNFVDEGLVWEYYYAKGIGLIWYKVSYQTLNFTTPMRYYQVF